MDNNINRNKAIARAREVLTMIDYSYILSRRAVINAVIDITTTAWNESPQTGQDFQLSKSGKQKKNYAKLTKDSTKVVTDIMPLIEEKSRITTKQLLQSEPKNKFDLDEFMALAIAGKTFFQRTTAYNQKLRAEIEAFIKTAQSENMSLDDTIQFIIPNLDKPQENKLILDRMTQGWFVISGLSALKSIQRLNADTLTLGYHRINKHYWLSATAKQIIAMHDPKTCQACTDMDGKIIGINEDILPMHSHCRCIEIPIL